VSHDGSGNGGSHQPEYNDGIPERGGDTGYTVADGYAVRHRNVAAYRHYAANVNVYTYTDEHAHEHTDEHTEAHKDANADADANQAANEYAKADGNADQAANEYAKADGNADQAAGANAAANSFTNAEAYEGAHATGTAKDRWWIGLNRTNR
jgi:hypothetical protein